MPQLDVSTFASQILWLIICFGTLYYLLSRKALPRVAEILEARQDRIAADLDEAQRLRVEAEAALAEYQAALGKAQAEAQTLLSESQAHLQAEAAARQAELDARLAEQVATAEAQIANAKQAALKELRTAAVGIAQAAAAQLAGLKVTEKAAEAALRDVLAEAA
ncbi:MAG: F0F1 ATP synthase subunit B' [Geminicoccaceae bacterium]